MRRLINQGAPLVVILAVAMLVVPLPTPLLDVLFLVNLALSLVIAVVALETPEPLEFSGFPSLLLLTTLLRIALDVSAARSILLTANAGTVVAAFGSFVVGQNPVVGILVFLLLFIVQYLVITRGAERVAEVAARFTLDAMAGKQMAIDADLHAGAITDEEARRRRARISQEADFYGAMDGATKYVRGDAIATLVVLLVNTIAGLAVGMMENHLSFSQAVGTYTTLAIGNALISQLPAFLLSTAAGVLVTRSGNQRDSLSAVLARQLMGRHQPLYVVAGFLTLLGVFLPVSPLAFGVAGALFYLGWRVQHRPAPAPAPAAPAAPPPRPGDALPDPITVTVGYGLVKMADPAQGGELFSRLTAVTSALSRELGFALPQPRVRDDLSLQPNQYRVQVRSLVVAEGMVFPDRELLLATSLPEVSGAVSGTDPVYKLPALWVPSEESARLAAQGHLTTPAAAVIAAHYRQALAQRAYMLFDRQQAQILLDRVRQVDKAAVEELVPGLLSLTAVHAVLQNLLRENVSVQDGVTIMETLADAAQQGQDVLVLTERVRQALAPLIRTRISQDGQMDLVTLGKPLEAAAEQAVRTLPEPGLDMEPRLLAQLIQSLKRVQLRSQAAALLVSPKLRPFFARLLELHLPGFPVLSLAEIDPLATYHVETVDV
jgi:flagellar biosynthesis protein FlhA